MFIEFIFGGWTIDLKIKIAFRRRAIPPFGRDISSFLSDPVMVKARTISSNRCRPGKADINSDTTCAEMDFEEGER